MARDCLFRAPRFGSGESGIFKCVLHSLSNQGIAFDGKYATPFSPLNGQAIL